MNLNMNFESMKPKFLVCLICTCVCFASYAQTGTEKFKQKFNTVETVPSNYKPVSGSLMDNKALKKFWNDLSGHEQEGIILGFLTIVDHEKEIYYVYSQVDEDKLNAALRKAEWEARQKKIKKDVIKWHNEATERLGKIKSILLNCNMLVTETEEAEVDKLFKEILDRIEWIGEYNKQGALNLREMVTTQIAELMNKCKTEE